VGKVLLEYAPRIGYCLRVRRRSDRREKPRGDAAPID